MSFVAVDDILFHHGLKFTGEFEFIIGLDAFLLSNRYQTISVSSTPHAAALLCSGSVAVQFTQII